MRKVPQVEPKWYFCAIGAIVGYPKYPVRPHRHETALLQQTHGLGGAVFTGCTLSV